MSDCGTQAEKGLQGVPTALGELEVGGMENFQMMANNFQAGLRWDVVGENMGRN